MGYGCLGMGEWSLGVWEWVNGVWVHGESHNISLFDQGFHNNVLVFDVDNGCHGFPLRPHEGGAKDHAQITGLHQVLLRVGSDAADHMRVT